MSKYLKKTIVDEKTGIQTEACIGVELVANLLTGKAHVKEGCWVDSQKISDGKEQAISPITWLEPVIDDLVTIEDYPSGTKLHDILFEVIGGRMVSMEKIPGTDIDNPFYGGTFEDLPAPTE